MTSERTAQELLADLEAQCIAIGPLGVKFLLARLKEIKADKEVKVEAAALQQWLKLAAQKADLKRQLKDAEADLDARAYGRYPALTVFGCR